MATRTDLRLRGDSNSSSLGPSVVPAASGLIRLCGAGPPIVFRVDIESWTRSGAGPATDIPGSGRTEAPIQRGATAAARGVTTVTAVSNPGSVARLIRRRSVTAVAVLGGLICLAAGREHPVLLVVGGVAVAIGLVTEVGRAVLAVRAGRLRTFWIPFPVAALLVVAVCCWVCADHGTSTAWLGLAAAPIMLVVGWALRHLPQDSVDLLAARLPGAPETAPPPPRRPYGAVTLMLLS